MSTRLRIKIWHRKQRYTIRRHRKLNMLYRVGVAVVGTVLLLAGLVMIPLPIPGPGWGAFFLGLGALSTEFAWAHRVTSFIFTFLRRVGHLTHSAWNRFDAVVHRRVERITGARLVQTWLDFQWSFQTPYALA
ncbi:PGPGW domain-containing protein [Gordonia sp. HY442]|uniref:PGPGW domain-containing protein n=1 Tax=Gordonia zhenghanii TaxID=2911516 RepID=UPI001F492CB0|nr:PGPGW domain-containing protein [Gordonia zhenghanii]MCF8603341.1 PGPGW domain-containing protein [Gordonia zhenghanii]